MKKKKHFNCEELIFNGPTETNIIIFVRMAYALEHCRSIYGKDEVSNGIVAFLTLSQTMFDVCRVLCMEMERRSYTKAI